MKRILRGLAAALILSALTGCGGGDGGGSGPAGTGGLERLGKAPRNITSDSTVDDQNPAFSPDGMRLIFSTHRTSGTFDVWVMGLDGANASALTTDGGFDSVNMPGSSWSGATGRICFASDRAGDNDEIWTMSENGSDLVRVTTNTMPDWEPTFSPDGTWIVFQSRSSGNWDIYKIKTDGTDLARLTTDAADDWEPNWSPNGDKIVFQSMRSGNWDVWIMDNAGGNLLNVTDDPAEDTDAFWSPDGGTIAFESDRDGNLDIFTTELRRFRSWAYQLQGTGDLSALVNTRFDCVVMDYSSDGSDDGAYTLPQIRALKASGPRAGRRSYSAATAHTWTG
jgi:TolB protein